MNYGIKCDFAGFKLRIQVDVKHSTDVKTWKKYSIRILSAIEHSAKSTIEIVDDDWFDELSALAEHGKERISDAKSPEAIFFSLSSSLANICFLQLGRIPSNAMKKQVSLRHLGNWKLNQYRSVQYVQSKAQKTAKAGQKANTKAAHNKLLNQIGKKVEHPV